MVFDNSISVNEEAIFTKSAKNPVYIVLSSGSSLFARGIKNVTKSEFSHAMISFNSKLDPLYSFGTKAGGKGLGFVINNPKDYVFDIEDAKYSVYVMYVTDKAKKAMQDALSFFIDNKDKLKYDFHGILDIWRGKASDQRQGKWFCSRFVMFLISKTTDISKAPSLWKPVDIMQLDNISLVNRGFNFYNYNYRVTERHCDNIKKGKYNVGDVIYENSSDSSIVYFTKNINPDSLRKIYHALNHPMRGNVGVKISTGEYGGHNYLKPELIKDLIEEVNGTIIECNTAYNGSRNTFKSHWDTIKKHGFTKIAKVDLMDETGDLNIPVRNGYHLKENIVGKSITNYNSIIMLSHFKGHMMAGYGGALKNMSIGMASAKGKVNIHTAGEGGDIMKADRNKFLESMVDADSAIIDYMNKDNLIYINIANNLSVDCDCDPHPHKPEIADIGIFASLDPVAVDQACIDAIYNLEDPKKKSLIQRIESRNGIHTIECAVEKSLGSRKYIIIDIDESDISIPLDSITEDAIDGYSNYFVNGSEYYLYEEYKRIYKPYYYKIPEVGFPTGSNTEYNEVIDAAKISASEYYEFNIKDSSRNYPFKFFNILNISKEKYIDLINSNVPMNKRFRANLYHVNIRDGNKKISIILVAIPGTIYAMYLLLPNDELHRFNYNGTSYQESSIFTHDDYKESAIMAQRKLYQLHDKHSMMNIRPTDIKLRAGKWIFAEYTIESVIDKDNVKRFSEFINKIMESSIYDGCIELPDNLKISGELSISEKSIYDTTTNEVVKYYKNPAKQLQIKTSKKRNDKIKTGNYTGSGTISTPTPQPTQQKPVKEFTMDIEKAAEYARKLLTKEILACKDCAYMYNDIMLPYKDDSSYAIIGWKMNKLKPGDDFDRCKNAVFNYCSKIYNQTHQDYCMECDDNCFYIYKK